MPNADWDQEFSQLLSGPASRERASSSLKARLYSAVVREQQASGPLASLDDTVAAGHGLCVFEKLVQIAPVGERLKTPFFCSVCHARVLAEHFGKPPIFWPDCPYASFKKTCRHVTGGGRSQKDFGNWQDGAARAEKDGC